METRNGQMKVLIADRDESIRSALKLLLSNEDRNIVIIESAGVAPDQSLGDYPEANLIIIDWAFAGADTESLTQQLHQRRPDGVIIVLSKRLEDKAAALEAGAQAFIYKGDPPDSLYHTLMPYLNAAPAQSVTPPHRSGSTRTHRTGRWLLL